MLCPLKWRFDPAKVYTVGAGIKWNESRKGCINKIDIGGGMTRNFYYETPNGAKDIPNWLSILKVESYTGTGNDIGGFDFWSKWPSSSAPKDIIGNTIHVEITNPFMYEGAFLNPPKEKSLDVQSIGNQCFLLKDHSNFDNAFETITPDGQVGRYRLLNLGTWYSRAMYFEGLLHKYWGADYWLGYYVRFGLYDGSSSAGISNLNPSLEIRAISKANDASERVASAQITLDESKGVLYFCVTTAYSIKTKFKFIPFQFFSAITNSDMGMAVPSDIADVGGNTPNTTDTVLKSVNVVQGF